MSKITAPLKSDQLHQGHHDKWSEIAEELLKLMSRLMATPGETGRKLRSELSGNNAEVISVLKSITACPECEVLLIRRAIQIYLDLSLDPSNIMDNRTSSTNFTWILLRIFLVPDDCFDKMLLGMLSSNQELLDMLSSNQEPSTILPLQSEEGKSMSMLQSVSLVLGNLIRAVVDAGNISNRVHAAEILEQ